MASINSQQKNVPKLGTPFGMVITYERREPLARPAMEM